MAAAHKRHTWAQRRAQPAGKGEPRSVPSSERVRVQRVSRESTQLHVAGCSKWPGALDAGCGGDGRGSHIHCAGPSQSPSLASISSSAAMYCGAGVASSLPRHMACIASVQPR